LKRDWYIQGRLPNELKMHQIETIEAANNYLRNNYLPRHNNEFMCSPEDNNSSYIAYIGQPLNDILCIKSERIVAKDNTVSYNNIILQIPKSQHRHHFVKAEVTINHYPDDSLAIFHGHLCLARYNKEGIIIKQKQEDKMIEAA